MLPNSFLEAAAALTIQALVLATMVAGASSAVRLQQQAWTLSENAFQLRQTQSLIEHSVSRAGAGPGAPAALGVAEPNRAVFHADLNGDGSIDSRNAETTAFEIVERRGKHLLRHRIGRQTMTVLADLNSASDLEYLTLDGLAADASTASVVVLHLDFDNGETATDMRFALPARYLQ